MGGVREWDLGREGGHFFCVPGRFAFSLSAKERRPGYVRTVKSLRHGKRSQRRQKENPRQEVPRGGLFKGVPFPSSQGLRVIDADLDLTFP